jgi:alpha-beta hydrolase superfamily lysophospholipase
MKLGPLVFTLICLTGCSVARPFGASLDGASEIPLTGCALEEKTQFDTFSAQQLQWYRSRGDEPIPAYRSQLLHGTNGRAVVVIHGFSSSPYPMNELMHALNAAGFTVIAPLLNGFAGNPSTANSSTPSDWFAPVASANALAKLCNSDVSLLSLSLGGTIAIDGIFNHSLSGVSHFVGLSSFLQPKSLIELVDTSFYPATPTLSSADVQAEFPGVDPYSFLPFPRPPAGAPPVYLPVLALHAMLGFAQTVDGLSASAPSNVPALEIVSDADGLMDVPASVTFMTAHFSSVTKTEYPSADGIGHSLESSAANPHFAQMVQQILNFLSD